MQASLAVVRLGEGDSAFQLKQNQAVSWLHHRDSSIVAYCMYISILVHNEFQRYSAYNYMMHAWLYIAYYTQLPWQQAGWGNIQEGGEYTYIPREELIMQDVNQLDTFALLCNA